jgi:hypothetical protein
VKGVSADIGFEAIDGWCIILNRVPLQRSKSSSYVEIMVKRSSKKKEHDFAAKAFRVVQEATEEVQPQQPKEETTEGKNPHFVALGRLGG